jgi:major membrane immunogen (membrane-anchored lipoprotein)
MSDLLKQAIADAKAVRATALSNAKAALEEHFAPKLQSMLSEKLKAEMEGDEAAPVETPAPEVPLPTDDMGGEEVHADAAQDAAMAAGGSPEGHADAAQDAAMAGGTETPTAPVGDEASLDELEGEVEEDTGTSPGTAAGGNPTPGYNLANLEEGETASGDYKKTTKGHKTEDPGKNMVKSVGTAIGGTKGSLSTTKRDAKASSDYTKTTTGHKTDDPQGQGNELSHGGYDKDTAALKENEEVDEASLDEILKELEDGLNEVGMEEMSDSQPAAEEEIDLNELLSESDDEEEGDEEEIEEGKLPKGLADYQKKHGKKHDDDDKEEKEETVKENISLKKELAEYRSAVVYLRDRINEVNLLNAKLLYTNKLFKQASLNNEQKLKVIESFDLTKSVREAKLVYATLAESFNFGGKKTVVAAPAPKKVVSQTVKSITEGLASKPVASTKPTKATVLTEGAEMANRFKKLAGIRSK